MAQGIFPARQELGFTPSTAVRANIDIRGTGGTGGAIGQAVVAGIGLGIKESKRRKLIDIRNRKNLDANSAVQADGIRDQADIDIEIMKGKTTPDKWEEKAQKIIDTSNTLIGTTLDFSPEEAERQQLLSANNSTSIPKQVFADGSRALGKIAVEGQEARLTGLFRSGRPDEIALGTRDATEVLRNNGKTAQEITAIITTAQKAGSAARAQDASNDVYAAIEAAADTGNNFEIAKELAKSPSIPESKQATLRSAIGTAERAQIARVDEDIRLAKATATSTAIRESYQGTLTISELDKRHEAGLISDSAFIKMREGLEAKIPAISDRVARSTINRAVTNFRRKAATRKETEVVFLDVYAKLDETDRRKFGDDIEKVFNTGVENSVHEAKTRGAAIISKKFAGILDSLKLGTKDAKQFDLEWELRNLYEDSIDDWVAQQVAKGTDPTPRQIRIMGNDLLIDFKKIKDSELDRLESTVKSIRTSLEQGKILGTKPLVAPKKPTKERTSEEIRARIQILEKKR